jgi:hypothetical protein
MRAAEQSKDLEMADSKSTASFTSLRDADAEGDQMEMDCGPLCS